MLKVIVAGSRDFDIFSKVEDTLMMYFKEHKLHRADVEIVSGAARGADRLGEQFAIKYGLKLTKFPADWDKYGKSAGYRRNAEMAKYADVYQVAQFADATIFVVKAESTDKSAVKAIAKDARIPNPMLVLNAIDMSKKKYQYLYK